MVISREIYTPLLWQVWAHELADHPDPVFVDFIYLVSIVVFHIGFHNSESLKCAGRNLYFPRPSLVSEYLSCEVQLGRMWKEVFPRVIYISPIGLVPKKNMPGKW